MLNRASFCFPVFLKLVSVLLLSKDMLQLSSCFCRLVGSGSASVDPVGHLYVFTTNTIYVKLYLFKVQKHVKCGPVEMDRTCCYASPFLGRLKIGPIFGLLADALSSGHGRGHCLRLVPRRRTVAGVRDVLREGKVRNVSPVTHRIGYTTIPARGGIILVFVRSVSTGLVRRFKSAGGLAPFLSDLCLRSLDFSRFCSTNVRAGRKVCTALCSFPTVVGQGTVGKTIMPICSKLPAMLGSGNCQGLFFVARRSRCSGVGTFLHAGKFSRVCTRRGCPGSGIIGDFNMRSSFLCRCTLPVLGGETRRERPFFAMLLSVDGRPSCIVPGCFGPRDAGLRSRVIRCTS